MSNLSMFLKKNKKVRSNAFYPASASFVDENGNPVKWEVRPLTTAEDEVIRDECTVDVPIPGKKGQYRAKIDVNAYMAKQMVAAIVFPDLNNAELQDSYGVMTPEDLLKEMIDNPSEYMEFANFIRENSGFDIDLTEEIKEAKN